MRNFRAADMKLAKNVKAGRERAKKAQAAPVVVRTYVEPETTEALEQDTDKE